VKKIFGDLAAWLACCIFTLVLSSLISVSIARADLTADQLLLITNKNDPYSGQLADLYAQLRHVPAGQTVALDLPDQEEMPAATYDTAVLVPLRQFITDHDLQDKIKCLVTFYGVPFRIGNMILSADDQAELAQLKKDQADVLAKAAPIVADLEKVAEADDPTFKPAVDQTESGLDQRADAAVKIIGASIDQTIDPQAHAAALAQLNGFFVKLGGQAQVDAEEGSAPADHEQALQNRQEFRRLESTPWDPAARAALRKLASDNMGLLGYSRVLTLQIAYLGDNDNKFGTGAATDNELALLWWGTYPRAGWRVNPFHYGQQQTNPPAIMVMRLDGPNPSDVQRIIRESIDVENTGLQGCIAIDARGLVPGGTGPNSAYADFDEKLRHLAAILRDKTQLKVVLDNRPEMFAPHSVNDVALYVGWYSPNNYVPVCNFNPGAVGYHIASFEMVHLHGYSSGWVHGLIGSGCDATLGPVAEPYLAAFPNPDDFFPLLLTGKYTMAEVYWKTTPMTSWMISFIGDPLYTPYKLHPAMKLEDLPDQLLPAAGE